MVNPLRSKAHLTPTIPPLDQSHHEWSCPPSASAPLHHSLLTRATTITMPQLASKDPRLTHNPRLFLRRLHNVCRMTTCRQGRQINKPAPSHTYCTLRTTRAKRCPPLSYPLSRLQQGCSPIRQTTMTATTSRIRLSSDTTLLLKRRWPHDRIRSD